MKAAGRVALLVLVAVVLAPAVVGANTFLVGFKAWPASWNAYIVDAYKDVLDGFDPAFDVTTDGGYGLVAGPVLGFQTDDAKWSVSFAAMVLNYFAQDADITYSGVPFEAVSLENSRMEFDFAVSRAINDNIKLFAGWKVQLASMVVSTSSAPAGYEIASTVHIPTVGVGFAYPLSQQLALGGQAGLLYTIPYVEVDGAEDDTFENTFGFTGEVTLSYLLRGDWILQGGYRFQTYGVAFDLYGDGSTGEFSDTFHRPTLSVLKVIRKWAVLAHSRCGGRCPRTAS